MKTGAPQGSLLSVLLFLLFVNDMHLSTTLEAILFADDSCLNHSSHSLQTLIVETNAELIGVADWFNANKMSLHPKKSKYVIYNALQSETHDDVTLMNVPVQQIKESNKKVEERYYKYVVVMIDEKLTFKFHVKHVLTKTMRAVGCIYQTRRNFPKFILKSLYVSLIKPHFEYGISVWGSCISKRTYKKSKLARKRQFEL